MKRFKQFIAEANAAPTSANTAPTSNTSPPSAANTAPAPTPNKQPKPLKAQKPKTMASPLQTAQNIKQGVDNAIDVVGKHTRAQSIWVR